MMGFCPYIKGSLKESECHHDGYCSECPHNTKDDTISRRAAIDELMKRDKALRNINWYDKPFAEGECKGIDDALEIINALPSVQPERKRGKWIVHPEVKNVYGGTYIECSQCGEKYVVQHMEDEKYCRNCGAKMEREQKHLGSKSDLVILDEVKYE